MKKSGTLNGLITCMSRREPLSPRRVAGSTYLRTFKTYSTFIYDRMEGQVWQIRRTERERKCGKRKRRRNVRGVVTEEVLV